MAFVNQKKKEVPATTTPAPAKKEEGLKLFGKNVDARLLLIPAVILVSGFIAALWLRSKRRAGSIASGATSTVQEAASAVVHATSEAVQPVVEKAKDVFRFGQY